MNGQLWQLVRFGLVGAVNTATYYVLYLVLHPFLPYFAAHTIAFGIGMIGSFFMNCRFTFRTRPTWKKFLLFPIPNAANYAVQSLALVALVQALEMDDRFAPLAAAAIAIPVTFVLSKLVLTGRVGSPQVEELRPAAVEVEMVDQ